MIFIKQLFALPALVNALFIVLSFSACTALPVDTYTPSTPAAQWTEPLPATQAHDGKLTDLAHWWQQFNDPLLLQLIEAAQKVSPDIESAKDRVIGAQSAVSIANASLLPSVNAEASASRSKSGMAYPTANGTVFPSTNTVSLGASASWELDVLGKNKSIKSKEEASLSGVNALWHEARVIVAAQTATQYSNYRLCENLLTLATHNAKSTNETVRLSELTAKAGFLAPASVSQSSAQAAEAANQQQKQALQCKLIVKSLVALTAIPEASLQNMLAKNSSVMPTPATIEIGKIPANLLAQRPDVLNAERNVAAASFEITANEAQRYPRLSLTGNIGIAYDSATSKFSERTKLLDGLTWGIGPLAISLPIFDAGVREANLISAKAQYEAAKSNYEGVARQAVREVEEAIATLNSLTARLKDARQSADGYRISLEAAQLRYKANLANLFELEEARRASLQAQMSLFTLNNEQTLTWISLYRAMGGGWTLAHNTPVLIFEFELKKI